MSQVLFERFAEAYAQPDREADRLRAAGNRIIRVIGVDAPSELLLAAGWVPIALVARASAGTARADALVSGAALSRRSRALLQAVLDVPRQDRVLISHADSELPQLYAILRELARDAALRLPKIDFIDVKHLPRNSTREYNQRRVTQLASGLGGVDAQALHAAIDLTQRQRALLGRLRGLRAGLPARLSGVQALQVLGSALILPAREHLQLLQELVERWDALPARAGKRVFVSGSNHEDTALYAMIEASGATIVGEDHDYGDPLGRSEMEQSEPWRWLANPLLREPLFARSEATRRERLETGIAESQPDCVICVSAPGDEAAAWDVRIAKQVCERRRIPILVLDPTLIADRARLQHALDRFFSSGEVDSEVRTQSSATAPRRSAAGPATRSRKSLRSLAALSDYQREWFQQLRQRAVAGEPIAVVNANAPQEILRALDIPFVVNQWWASIVAAKQQSPRYLALLREQGYPTEFDSYSAQGLAAALDAEMDHAPWGGLPCPTFLHALNGTDGTSRLFEAWARETSAELFVFERTVDTRWDVFGDWWRQLPDRWDEALETERIDLLTTEMRELIAQLERRLGRSFSMQKFTEVMNLVNEQESYYRLTRDLIARTSPAPVSIVDTMPATMTPQWQRGTVWARDAARAFYEEVSERAARGDAACANERLRLMWVGRGMWSEMGFYQRWEDSHGAVFVWSMYLALAADGYIRHFDDGRDPLRALAARVVTMGDELRMPTWAGAWHLHEARTHGVHGAVALADADPFVLRALSRGGIPVLALPLDNFNQEGVDRAAIENSVTEFIEGPVTAYAGSMRP